VNSQKRFAILLLGCLIFLIAGIVPIQKAAQKPGSTDVPVTAALADYLDVTDSSGATQRVWMQLRSDGAGVYKNTKDVQSIVQGVGDWVLDTNFTKYSTRSVFVDFSKPIAGSGPNGGNPTPPFTSGLVKARIISKCHETNNNYFTIPTGQTVVCPMVAGFYVGADFYRIHNTPSGDVVFPYTETDFVNVTCKSMGANLQCNQWKVEPNGTKGGCATADCSVKQNVVRLVKVVTAKGKTTEINEGDFYMSFSIGITNP